MKTYFVKYADETKTKLLDYVEDPESAKVLGFTDIIEGDFNIINYKNFFYTPEQFQVIKDSQEYKDEMAGYQKESFDYEAKDIENEAQYIQYKGKKISLQEILFKSLIYTSITDAYVYLKTEDGDLIKVLRATFLLIVAKAKSNLKAVEDALYDADNQYDPKKTLEENIAKIKGIFDAIDKIFND